MIKTVAEHSFDESLIPQSGGIILDLGCRGFQFKDYFKSPHKVISVDIDDLIGSYYHVAITDFNGTIAVERFSDPQATRVNKKMTVVPTPEEQPTRSVPCYTLDSFLKYIEIDFVDLIKMDIEGSEYQVIMSMDRPMAKQLSIEFHLHTGQYSQYEMTLMEDKLKALGYIAIQHEMTDRHCAGMNYWDSLFILK